MISSLIILCSLVWNSYQTGTAVFQQSALLYRHWIHSQEDDNPVNGYRVYRPSTYPFPPARGREGFEIKKNGSVLSHPIAAADGNQTVPEKWKLDKAGKELTITGKTTASRFAIVSLTRDKLTLKPLPVQNSNPQ